MDYNTNKTEKRDVPRALMLASVASMIDLFNRENVELLQLLGYKVDVAANFSHGSITSQERVDVFKKELEGQGIEVYNIPIPRSLVKVKEIINSYHSIKKIVNRNRYDIVHCHSPIGGVLCRLACRTARRKGTKVIYTAHGFHFYKGAKFRAWLLYYPAERICSRWTDILITINSEDYMAARNFNTCKVKYVAGIGIDTNKYTKVDRRVIRTEYGLADDDFVFASTGQLSKRKNHKVVIQALDMLYNSEKGRTCDKNIKYLVIGFGEKEEELKQLVSEKNLDDKVVFAGYQSGVREILSSVDAFVFPSIQEGLPVALMEAMAEGLPIVASKIRGNVDLIENEKSGYLVDYNAPEQFADAMLKIVNGDNSQMRAREVEKIKAFDKNVVNACMKNIYKEVTQI